MTKPEIISEFMREYGYTKSEASRIYRDISDFILNTLAKGKTINIYGLFEMGTRSRKEREGVNPHTHKPMVIPSKRIPYCRFGDSLKDKIASI